MATTLVVATGRAIITNRLKGSGTEPLNAGWGTAAGTTADSDTTLFTEKADDLSATSGSRDAGVSTQQTTTTTSDTYQVVATKVATGAGTVTNAGLFDNITIASGNLFMKGDFTGIALSATDSIQFTFKAAFA
jgi:hypothetical protein